jgi:hypothetical protein
MKNTINANLTIEEIKKLSAHAKDTLEHLLKKVDDEFIGELKYSDDITINGRLTIDMIMQQFLKNQLME